MNKRSTIFFALFTMATFFAHAQTTSGSMMLGGGFRIYTQGQESNEDYDYSELEFSPSFGYFVTDNLVVGLNFTVNTTKQDNGGTAQKYNAIALGPFARFYKFTSNEQFAFFAQAGFNFGSGKTDYTPGGETKSSFVNFNISPGFAYFFNNHWAAELALSGFSVSSRDPNKDVNDDKYSTVIFDIRSFNPSLGIRYHFGGN